MGLMCHLGLISPDLVPTLRVGTGTSAPQGAEDNSQGRKPLVPDVRRFSSPGGAKVPPLRG